MADEFTSVLPVTLILAAEPEDDTTADPLINTPNAPLPVLQETPLTDKVPLTVEIVVLVDIFIPSAYVI